MNRLEKLLNLEDTVKKVLLEKPKTRLDDFILYVEVLRELDIDVNKSLEDLFNNHHYNRLPVMESVSRARIKVFEKKPELVNEYDKLIKQSQEEIYKKYSRL